MPPRKRHFICLAPKGQSCRGRVFIYSPFFFKISREFSAAVSTAQFSIVRSQAVSRAHLNLSKFWPMGPRPESAAYKQRLDKSVIYLIILKFQK